MITNVNALQSALAHLLAEKPGCRISMDARLRNNVSNFYVWMAQHGLEHNIVGGKLTLWRKAENPA